MHINDLEKAILVKALAGGGKGFEHLRNQVDNLGVKTRKYTGVGFFVDFETIGDRLRVDVPDCEITNIEGETYALKRGFGCVIFIKNGQVAILECFSYDEPWPSDLGTFRIWQTVAKPANL